MNDEDKKTIINALETMINGHYAVMQAVWKIQCVLQKEQSDNND